MTVPSAPTEGGGSKILFVMYDNAGTNAAAILKAIATETMNSETVGYLAVATHTDGEADGGSEPGVLIMGTDGSNVYPLTVDSSGRLVVMGAAAHGGTAVGNVVRIGGVYRTSDPSLANNQIGDLSIDSAGRVEIVGAAADDAAAVGAPVLIGGIYQATPDSIDDGDVARLRLNSRRAMMTAGDVVSVVMANAVAITDTTWHPYTLDVNTYGAREISMSIYNTHDQPTDVIIGLGISGNIVQIYSGGNVVPATTGEILFAPDADFTGSLNYVSIPPLRSPTERLYVSIHYDVAPTTGAVTITAILRS